METAYKQPPVTYEDYCELPDDKRYELIGGELYLTPSPKSFHQIISGNIFTLLSNFVRDNNLGTVISAPMDVKLTETDVVQPDILFIRVERKEIIKENFIDAGPDLVVEVISEATRDRDTVIKKQLYFRHGVEEYWLVDPEEEKVTVMVRGDSGFEPHAEQMANEQLESPLLSDFSPTIEAFFTE